MTAEQLAPALERHQREVASGAEDRSATETTGTAAGGGAADVVGARETAETSET
jgi:hypothetical protein